MTKHDEQRKRLGYKRIAIGVTVALLFLIAAFVVHTIIWLQGEQLDVAHVTNTADIRMSCFADYGVIGVDVAVERRIPNDLVPGPEDAVFIAFGYVELDASGMERIRNDFAWRQVDTAQIPTQLNGVLPQVELLSSSGFNDSFDLNHDYRYGLAWIAADDAISQNRVYYFASNKPFD